MKPMEPVLKGKHILIMGLGRSGLTAARFAAGRGAHVTVTDAARAPIAGPAMDDLRALGVELALGGHPESIFAHTDLIVLSPGVPHTLAPLERARRQGIAVVGEMELAARFITAPVVAVTGTNGKTTTTELVGQMLAASGQRVFVGGNIGTPLIGFVDRPVPVDTVVAEVSSFQLDTMERFKPAVAVLLNITEDHLDRYADFEAYAASKARIFMNQTRTDTAVFNAGDPRIQALVQTLPAVSLPFFHDDGATLTKGHPGARIQADRIRIVNAAGQSEEISLARSTLCGGHNRENIAAAALAALAAGATRTGIQAVVDRFTGLSHRLETVATVAGVTYVDDSKATNVDAVVRAIDAFEAPLVLILGGRDKGGDYRVLTDRICGRVRHLILMGEAADRIEQALGSLVPTHRVADMAQAVARAKASAEVGDVVLLSPACASFDMYDSYTQRGEDFRKRVGERT
ncbi:MAG: UDP-N-acetylmuramoyl-L-alanine--D-glutamate ligase [Desulfobacterales bacterium]|nr:UDP-N-acetylmuramoyl-L-alanine--D-glutamate ligase [Desulfobacterales bacterium]